jgi:bifunctional ADP-heptose synthase (sugar kinase/adenylyltransferase)
MNILLIGDNCIDEYNYGTVERISPEAPVPILNFQSKEERPGMAANVYENFKALGVEPTFLTSEHSRKIRYIDVKTKQHLLRLDYDPPRDPISVNIDVNIFDCIVISDYDKGTVNCNTIMKLRSTFRGPIFIDTKKRDLVKFKGCFIKINELEYSNAISLPPDNDIIITRGKKGAEHKSRIYSSPEVDVFDVCGAGDTFLAALVYRYYETESIPQSIVFANAASAVTVKHSGVYSPTLKEIQENLAK